MYCNQQMGGFTWDTIYQYSGNLIGALQKDNHLFLFSQNSAGGCHVSHDYGQTWQQFPGVSFNQAQNFTWHNGVLIALKDNKILRSFNLGETWESVDINAPNNTYNSVLASSKDGSALFLGSLFNSSDGIISKSLDLGLSWAPSAFGVLAEGGKLRTRGDNLYAAGNAGLSTLKSDGLNWEQVVAPNSVNLGQYQTSFLDYLAFDNTELILTPANVLYSVDAGATWQNSDLSLLQPIAYRNKIGKAAGRVVLVEDYDNTFHGLAVSNNGGKSFQIRPL
jgi:BNR/Asp-box repeat.